MGPVLGHGPHFISAHLAIIPRPARPGSIPHGTWLGNAADDLTSPKELLTQGESRAYSRASKSRDETTVSNGGTAARPAPFHRGTRSDGDRQANRQRPRVLRADGEAHSRRRVLRVSQPRGEEVQGRLGAGFLGRDSQGRRHRTGSGSGGFGEEPAHQGRALHGRGFADAAEEQETWVRPDRRVGEMGEAGRTDARSHR